MLTRSIAGRQSIIATLPSMLSMQTASVREKRHKYSFIISFISTMNNNNNIGHLYCAATIIIYSTAHYNNSYKTCIILIT